MRYRFFVVVRHNVVDGRSSEEGLVRATPPTKGELHNARSSVRSVAVGQPSRRAAQKFQSIPLAAVSQIYLNRHGVTQRWLGASFETLPERTFLMQNFF